MAEEFANSEWWLYGLGAFTFIILIGAIGYWVYLMCKNKKE